LARQELPEYSYAARRGRPALDPAMRRIALLAGGLCVLVIGVALAWSGMRPGIGFGPPPVIAPPPGPLRMVPANPGGLTVPEADVPIMSGSADGTPQLAPQLAAPTPAPALTQLSADAGLATNAAPAPPTPAASTPAPTAATPAAPPATGAFQVQLAATADEAGAAQTWAGLSARLPTLLGGRQPDIIPAVVNGVSVWRLRLGGFGNEAAAQSFCAALTAQNAACLVIDP
jgi:hypothetical protein